MGVCVCLHRSASDDGGPLLASGLFVMAHQRKSLAGLALSFHELQRTRPIVVVAVFLLDVR